MKLRLFVTIVAFSLMLVAGPAFADDNSKTLVRQLREIGHVRATSSFCSALAAGGAPATEAALAFEVKLYQTIADFFHFNRGSGLAKSRSVGALENDLRELADDTRQGRSELSELREKSIASGSDADQEIVAFADALSGAQGRQLEMTRRLARVLGTLEEIEPSSIVDGPLDHSSADGLSSKNSPINILEGSPFDEKPLPYEANFFSAPGDDFIGRDLARAAEHARQAELFENCS